MTTLLSIHISNVYFSKKNAIFTIRIVNMQFLTLRIWLYGIRKVKNVIHYFLST